VPTVGPVASISATSPIANIVTRLDLSSAMPALVFGAVQPLFLAVEIGRHTGTTTAHAKPQRPPARETQTARPDDGTTDASQLNPSRRP
jgi:hypothetical protein